MSVLNVMKLTVTRGKSLVVGALEGQRGFEEAFFSSTPSSCCSTPSSYFCRCELYYLRALLEYPLRDRSI